MTERERLIALLKQIPKNAYRALYAYEDYDEFADYLLDHGVRIPVRCEKCKWSQDSKMVDLWCKHPDSRNPWGCLPGDFCNNGERKDEELSSCTDENADPYSDVFLIDAEIKRHSVIKQKYERE